jgi:DNA-binding NarL/FixJ family response regulator
VKSTLIVDDSPHVRRGLRKLLETKQDWVVWEAENGGDAIDRAKELRPDLIVIDLAMPVLNGIVATSVLKKIMPAVSIVMFTAFGDPHIKRMAMAAGLDSFVDKSESPEILLGSIEQLLVQRSDSAA